MDDKHTFCRWAPVVIAASVLASGCSSMSERQEGTAKGAGAGAVAGAVLSGATGGSATRGAVIGGAVGAVAGNLWSKRMEDKQRELAASTAGSGIVVDRTNENQLRVSVPSDLSFDPGSSDIKASMRPALDELSRNLDSTTRITVVGHSDNSNDERGNYLLSLQRAEAVRSYLAARGVDPLRITAVGRGASEPLVSGSSTDAARAMNRRVEIFVAEHAG
jgi:outer membrane protein OmpA-like peptidoglycan-associated protein